MHTRGKRDTHNFLVRTT